MKGIQYVVDDQGHPKAVQIDLKKHGRLWEDFQDVLISRGRRHEPRETLEEVEARLVKEKKLT
jgi:hypothetical protein